MKYYVNYIFYSILFLVFTNCSKKNETRYSDEQEELSAPIDGYEDGLYCAEIDYYYSETGTNSTYTLEVEIEDNELIKIHWPNGGWLDDSHFSPPDISDGIANFSSDRGIEYTVTIIGEEGDCSLDNYVVDEDQLINDVEEDKSEQEEREQEEREQEERDEYESRQRKQQQEEEIRRQEEEEEEKQREDE